MDYLHLLCFFLIRLVFSLGDVGLLFSQSPLLGFYFSIHFDVCIWCAWHNLKFLLNDDHRLAAPMAHGILHLTRALSIQSRTKSWQREWKQQRHKTIFRDPYEKLRVFISKHLITIADWATKKMNVSFTRMHMLIVTHGWAQTHETQ